MQESKTVKFTVKRQDEPDSKPYYDTFEVPYQDGMNVTTLLMETKQFPTTC